MSSEHQKRIARAELVQSALIWGATVMEEDAEMDMVTESLDLAAATYVSLLDICEHAWAEIDETMKVFVPISRTQHRAITTGQICEKCGRVEP